MQLRKTPIGISVFLTLSACMPMPAAKFDSPIQIWTQKKTCDGAGWIKPYRLSEHVLVSDSQGNIPTDPARHDGKFSKAFMTIMNGYRKANTEKAKAGISTPLRLLFYFNGGLNPQSEVEADAEKQIPCILSDGFYPIFFAWDTEFFKSYSEQIAHIWDGFYRDEWWRYVLSPFRVGAGLVSGIGQAPVDYVVEGRRVGYSLFRSPECDLRVRDAPEACRVTFNDEPAKLDRFQSRVEADPNADRNTWRPLPDLAYGIMFPFRLALTPVANALGDSAWKNFVRRSRTTVRPSREFESLSPENIGDTDPEIHSFQRGTGVFSKFFETLLQYRDPNGLRLCAESKSGPSDRKDQLCGQKDMHFSPSEVAANQEMSASLRRSKITLIGHSMGGIIINELIERFPDLGYSDIVVMASAASVRETRRVLDRYFEKEAASKDTRFYSLMLHPLADLRERQALGAVPSGSLLVWIDQFYEVPKTPEDRTFGYWPNARVARRMFGQKAQREMLFRVFNTAEAKPGENSNPVQHGDFNNDDMCFWRPAFWGVKRGSPLARRYSREQVTGEPGLPDQALTQCAKAGR